MKLHDTGVYLVNGVPQTSAPAGVTEADAKKGTIAYGILKAHNTGDSMQDLRMKFDSMTSHDITYVGIIQTARASGMTEFPLPYVMTNCHNSLCAVGGTINEDDHQLPCPLPTNTAASMFRRTWPLSTATTARLMSG